MKGNFSGDFGLLFKDSRQIGGFLGWEAVTEFRELRDAGIHQLFNRQAAWKATTTKWWLFESLIECEVEYYYAIGSKPMLAQPRIHVKLYGNNGLPLDTENETSLIMIGD